MSTNKHGSPMSKVVAEDDRTARWAGSSPGKLLHLARTPQAREVPRWPGRVRRVDLVDTLQVRHPARRGPGRAGRKVSDLRALDVNEHDVRLHGRSKFGPDHGAILALRCRPSASWAGSSAVVVWQKAFGQNRSFRSREQQVAKVVDRGAKYLLDSPDG